MCSLCLDSKIFTVKLYNWDIVNNLFFSYVDNTAILFWDYLAAWSF
jgi:hypothetical protein